MRDSKVEACASFRVSGGSGLAISAPQGKYFLLKRFVTSFCNAWRRWFDAQASVKAEVERGKPMGQVQPQKRGKSGLYISMLLLLRDGVPHVEIDGRTPEIVPKRWARDAVIAMPSWLANRVKERLQKSAI
jgi:hypothetical protein